MATKKISLNELRRLVKKVINENEFDKDFEFKKVERRQMEDDHATQDYREEQIEPVLKYFDYNESIKKYTNEILMLYKEYYRAQDYCIGMIDIIEDLGWSKIKELKDEFSNIESICENSFSFEAGNYEYRREPFEKYFINKIHECKEAVKKMSDLSKTLSKIYSSIY